MAEQLDNFELPRLDWHDEEGRIYKDVLIENFNAIQDKLLEISQLDAFEIAPPDISSIVYPDTTLESEDKAIVNLKSFLRLTGLIGYPLECQFSGNTCTKLAYWGEDYTYHTLSNKKTSANKTNPYVYFNHVNGTIASSNSSNTPTNCVLIGFYTDGRVRCVNNADYLGINLLYYLSRMNIETLTVDMYNSVEFREHGVDTGHKLNGATVGGTDLDTGSRGYDSRFGISCGQATFMRLGRTSK